ncbi:serine/threonine/tyrosine-interacting-like protein 1 isoform X2 [Mastacembelus armatus]|uniref:serine/threonine/tyrosine-interacting-like protein 1 isoform X2 n=1 Tax=Mastacembelus armatus TaxID=205130 RepID=UPI000E463C12|nr:serine/threonine/tyrosine-interacting-like protein 1 isoform X2 [Mastacembelus armatus]
MAEILMCEPFELFNLLNQYSCVSRLAEINYLCLIDARDTQEYNTSHVVTAKNVKMDSEGTFCLPETVEFESMQHVVVYDSNTTCLQNQGRAVECAQALAKVTFHPVRVVRGGFQKFSALYPFLRTEKIIYTIMELENLKTYPVEIIAGLLYMGDKKQGTDSIILKDLKIFAVVSISQSNTVDSMMGNQTTLYIPVADSVVSDLFSTFEMICSFIGSHIHMGSRVLVVSSQGRSRCSAVIIAFLMYHFTYTLEEAWKYMLRCKSNMRLNTGFLQQLSDWELHTMGKKVTDISFLIQL